MNISHIISRATSFGTVADIESSVRVPKHETIAEGAGDMEKLHSASSCEENIFGGLLMTHI